MARIGIGHARPELDPLRAQRAERQRRIHLAEEAQKNFIAVIEKEFGAARKGFNYQFAYIHADVGEHGKTKEMVKEVTGLIKGHGFEPMIKPLSFAASVVADRFT